MRGRITLISVNLPSCVSTSIAPACCFTMMSWLKSRHVQRTSSCLLWAKSRRFRAVQLFCRRFCQREFALMQWARYTIAAIEFGFPPTINASSSFTR